MWAWDTEELTFDQTCWYFDGSNECGRETGGKRFFQTHGYGHPYDLPEEERIEQINEREAMIKKMDNEVIDLIVTLLTKGII